jgi:hypothetical protein
MSAPSLTGLRREEIEPRQIEPIRAIRNTQYARQPFFFVRAAAGSIQYCITQIRHHRDRQGKQRERRAAELIMTLGTVGDDRGAEPGRGKAERERCHEAGLASDRGVGVQSALVMDETSEKRSDEMDCCHVRNAVRLVGLPICFHD